MKTLSAVLDKLKDFASQGHPHLEIELRYRLRTKTNEMGVSLSMFNRIKDGVMDLAWTMNKTKDIIYSSWRETTVYDDMGLEDYKYYTSKVQLYSEKYPDLHAKLSVAAERVKDTPPPDLGNPSAERNKTRWSAVIQPGFRLDLTEVTGGEKPVYELELEIIPEPDIISNVPNLPQAAEHVLEMLLNTREIYTEAERMDTVKSLNSLISTGKKGNAADLSILHQPRNLKIKDMVIGGLIPGSSRGVSYTVTKKADGTRGVLLIDKTGLYIFGKDSYPSKILGRKTALGVKIMDRLSEWYNTVFEGEVITKTKDPEYTNLSIYFLIYDTLAYKSSSAVRKKGHTARIAMAKEFETYTRGLAYGEGRVLKNKGYLFETKEFRPFTTVSMFYAEVNYVLSKESVYYDDGLIFTPDNVSYEQSVSKKPLGVRSLASDPETLKWKPPEQLTIDFSIGHVATENGPKIQIYSGYSPTWTDRRKQLLDKAYDGITQEPVLFVGTLDHPIDPKVDVQETPLLTYSPDGTVIEFVWKNNRGQLPSLSGATGQFQALRTRYDKAFPNALDVAIDVWKDIMSPLTESVITGKSFGLMFRYHNREKEALFMKTKGARYLLDIGSGRGGDVRKWVKAGYTHVLCVEPNEENRLELSRRLASTSLEYKILATTGQDTGVIVDAVKSTFPGGKVNTISYMLSLSFFFDTPESIQSIGTLCGECLLPSGRLIAFTIDGEKTKTLFNTTGQYTQYNDTRVSSMTMIDFELTGNKVYINIPNSIVTKQVEYLVDIPKLGETLASHGMVLELELPTTGNKFMTSEENTMTELYTSLMYTKHSAIPVGYDQLTSVFNSGISGFVYGNEPSKRNRVLTIYTKDGNVYTTEISILSDGTLGRPVKEVSYEGLEILQTKGLIAEVIKEPDNQEQVGEGNSRLLLILNGLEPVEVVCRYNQEDGTMYKSV